MNLGSVLGTLAPIAGAVIGNMIAPGAGGLIAGALVGSGVSSAVSSQDALSAQQSANAANIQMTQDTNSSEIALADTAHQREVADLKAAGLNPILSAKLGGSATPSLTAPQTTSLAPTILSSAQQAQTTALSGAAEVANYQLTKSQILNTSAQAVKTEQDARRQALENDVLEQAVKSRRYAETVRAARPDWIKAAGVDIGDTMDTFFSPVAKAFGALK